MGKEVSLQGSLDILPKCPFSLHGQEDDENTIKKLSTQLGTLMHNKVSKQECVILGLVNDISGYAMLKTN